MSELNDQCNTITLNPWQPIYIFHLYNEFAIFHNDVSNNKLWLLRTHFYRHLKFVRTESCQHDVIIIKTKVLLTQA